MQELRPHLGEVFKRLASRGEAKVLEGHLMPDHVHMLLSIPPKYAVSHVVGYIKGKSAIHLARTYGERQRNFVGQNFWARGYFVTRLVGTRKRSEPTSKNRRRKTARLSKSTSSGETAAYRRLMLQGAALASPHRRLSRLIAKRSALAPPNGRF